jgi:hypothetical protein
MQCHLSGWHRVTSDPRGEILYALASGYVALTSQLTIYVYDGWTRHFVAYCFKPVTGLIVSRILAVATVRTALPRTGRDDLLYGPFKRKRHQAAVYYGYIS